MMDDYNTFRYTSCEQCGGRFRDDCGDSFCSSSCEREYVREHEACQLCEEEVGADNLTNGICENCEEEEQ